MAICLLIRHGHSTSNAAGTLSGRAPGVRLSERGESEVARLAAALAHVPLAGIWSSPLERCRATAAAIAEAHEPRLLPAIDDGLIEVGYGAWTNGRLADLAKDALWRQVQREPDTVTFPASADHEAESIAGMAHRMTRAIRVRDDLVSAEHGPDAVWVAVSHGDPIKAVLADAAGTPLRDFQRFVVESAGVVALRFTPERTFVLGSNLDPSRIGALVTSTGHGADGAATPGGTADPAGEQG